MTAETTRAIEIFCREQKELNYSDQVIKDAMVNLGAYCILMRKEPGEKWDKSFLEYLEFIADKYDRLTHSRNVILDIIKIFDCKVMQPKLSALELELLEALEECVYVIDPDGHSLEVHAFERASAAIAKAKGELKCN